MDNIAYLFCDCYKYSFSSNCQGWNSFYIDSLFAFASEFSS